MRQCRAKCAHHQNDDGQGGGNNGTDGTVIFVDHRGDKRFQAAVEDRTRQHHDKIEKHTACQQQAHQGGVFLLFVVVRMDGGVGNDRFHLFHMCANTDQGSFPDKGGEGKPHGGNEKVQSPIADQRRYGVVDDHTKGNGEGDQEECAAAMLFFEHHRADLEDRGPYGKLQNSVQYPYDHHKGEILIEIDCQITKACTDVAKRDKMLGAAFVGNESSNHLREGIDQIEHRHDRAGLRLGHHALVHDKHHRRGEAIACHTHKGIG